MIDASMNMVELVKKSKLTEEEKNKALKSHKKMKTTTIWVVILASLFMGIAIVYGMSQGGDILFSVISIIVAIVVIIIYAVFAHKFFPDWAKYSNLVDKGFDGLTNEEINKVKPNAREETIIKTLKKKEVLLTIVFLAILGVEFFIILNLGIAIYSPITIIIIAITTIIWYIKKDSYTVEIHRIESGYYKKGFGYICQHCKNEVTINFSDIEQYNSLPKNANGIREMKCPICNSAVSLYNFDNTLEHYKKYLKQIK